MDLQIDIEIYLIVVILSIWSVITHQINKIATVFFSVDSFFNGLRALETYN